MTDSTSGDGSDQPRSGFPETGVRYIILTVSDRSTSATGENNSGLALQKLIQDRKGTVVFYSVLPADDISKVEKILGSAVEQNLADVILTIGGLRTAFKDETPEDYIKTIDQREPGVITGMIFASFEETSVEKLSRALCGVINRVLINNLPGIPNSAVCGISQCNKVLVVNLPGSQETATQCFEVLTKAMPYAVAFMKDGTPAKVKLLNGETEEDSSSVEMGVKSKVPEKLTRSEEKSDLEVVKDKVASQVIGRIIKLNWMKETEKIDVKDGYGRVLAKDLNSTINVPSREEVSVNGFAMRAAEGVHSRTVSDQTLYPASEVPKVALKAYECVKVLAGSPMPPGADTVIPENDVKFLPPTTSADNKQQFKITPNYYPKKVGVRASGSIVKAGQLIVEGGKRLESADLGRIASVGITELCVYKKPMVAILSTGNELFESSGDKEAKPGRVYDSNRIILISILKKNGFNVIDVGIAADDPTCIMEKLSYALDHADVVVSTGGISGAENDFVAPVLQTDLGASIQFRSIRMKPGNSTTFATVKWDNLTKLVFALPGDPLVAFISTILFVLPALRQMEGIIEYEPIIQKVQVKIPEKSSLVLKEVPEISPVRLSYEGSNMIVLKEHVPVTGTFDQLIKDSELQRTVLMRFPSKAENQNVAEVKEDFVTSAVMLQDYL